MIEEMKNTAADALTAGKETLVGRLASPVLGPFLLTWAFFNYRLFFVLFSGEKLVDRFKMVDEITSPLAEWIFSRGLLWPAGATAVYILALPWVVEGVHRWNLWMKRRIREAELKSSGEEVLTKPASKLIYAQIDTQKKAFSILADKERAARISWLGWRAAALTLIDVDASYKEKALYKFLVSAEFEVRSDEVTSGLMGSMNLDHQGNASLNCPFLKAGRFVTSWSMSGCEVVLENANGVEVGKLVFRPELGGALNGRIGSERVLISSPEVKLPA